MKQLFVKPFGQFVILVALVFSQFVFAGDLIKKGDDDPSTIYTPSTASFAMESSLYVIDDVTIDILGSDLVVNFNSPVGIATVTISDKNGNIVYQTVEDTDITSEVIIPVSFFTSGTYTVKVAYGTSVYTEQVEL